MYVNTLRKEHAINVFKMKKRESKGAISRVVD